MNIIELNYPRVITNFPYFVIRNELESSTHEYEKELVDIKKAYMIYEQGAKFTPEGSCADYLSSDIQYKISSTLINKEARFMFSRMPDINIIANTSEQQSEVEQYATLVRKVLERNNFQSYLLKSAKDCFIGKRIACLVDYSLDDGIQTHFYTSLQFIYETVPSSKRIRKFVSFEKINKESSNEGARYLVNKYVDINKRIYMSSIIYTGTGKVVEELISEQQIEFDYIPVVIIVNDGTLENNNGVSEILSQEHYESGYSCLANADIDSEKKGMNPIRYTVDMNPSSTKNLSSSAGSYWDLKHDLNINEPSPSVGTLAPSLNHTEPLKVTLDRLKATMYNELEVPNISEETMVGVITSGKALKALYWGLSVRCDEKMIEWSPALQSIAKFIIDYGLLNKQEVAPMYELEILEQTEALYSISVEDNYALLDDETEEKTSDLSEIAQSTRSRFSYIKKWRKTEFRTDEQIEEELLRIAMEENMLDTMSMNMQVQSSLNKQSIKSDVKKGIEEVEIEKEIEKQV